LQNSTRLKQKGKPKTFQSRQYLINIKMKNKLSLLLIAMCAILILGTTSCKKEVIGCTDASSINYNQHATQSNNSCEYEGTVTFWMDGTTTTNGSVTVLINGTYGTIYSPVSSAPKCGNSLSANFTLPIGDYTFIAEDNFPVSFQNTGTLTVTKNQCLTMLLY